MKNKLLIILALSITAISTTYAGEHKDTYINDHRIVKERFINFNLSISIFSFIIGI
jgi:hypothetical protein